MKYAFVDSADGYYESEGDPSPAWASGMTGVPVRESPPASPVPKSITALQGLLAIDHFGLSSAYEAWANNPDLTFAQRAFINKAQTWNRDDATLNAAAISLGLTSEQVDSMFILAATL